MAKANKAAGKKPTTRKAAKKPVVRRKSAARSAATKRSPRADKSASHKPVSRKAAPRRPAAKAGTRKAGPRKPQSAVRPPQRFVVSHHRDEDFATGLRAYAQYRDLGIAAATQGLAQAHVIRLIGPCNPEEVSKLHYHDVEFQMVYVLKGWVKAQFDGEGVVEMREGSCWIQPPQIRHMILDYADNSELLEIILPAEFETVELA
ncbi:cupin domain-containing protein [Bradyrhizobium prioriisuperbiae]|uniref:cupin domain-containing protein n=1 Tax=Bradyrhizobium prioriisuperbiae TaxID=2854389 RepID=UPI0028E59159|nr:cupin domain-containing protein [Bradyrhizobium prioritasuperba]